MGNRYIVSLALLFICMLPLCSCTARSESKPAMLHAKPVDLFAGESKKFQPFMGTMTGAMKLNYTGDKKKINVSAEIWENGVKTQSLGTFSSGLQNPEEKWVECEFIVSIKELQEANQQGAHYTATAAIVGKNGFFKTEYRIDSSIEHTAKMPVTLGEEKKVPDSEEIAVWGLQATDGNSMRTIDFTPESLKNAKWVVLFKLRAADE